MQTIKLVRLHNDELIITGLEATENGYIFNEPFIVYLFSDEKTGRQSISLDYWLPVPIMENNEAFVKNDDILVKMTPSSVFLEYYQNAVVKAQEKRNRQKETFLEDEDTMTQEEMKILLETIEPPGSKYIN